MLTLDQRAELEQNGYVHMPGAFPRARADAMADRVWSYLEQNRGVRRNDRETWRIDAPWGGLKTLKDEPLFQHVGSSALCGALDDLLGPDNWQPPRNWGGFLVSLPAPAPATWQLPGRGWHVDDHFTYDPGTRFGVRVLVFLTEVGPCGGGTLVVRGSHRLVARYVAAMTPDERHAGYSVLRDQFCASEPWLAELTGGDPKSPTRTARFLDQDHEIDGISLRVVQLCGAPGDIVLAHPWFLHAASANNGPGPRFQLAKDIRRTVPDTLFPLS